MKKILNLKNIFFLGVLALVGVGLIFSSPTLAQSCPSNTTVTGTSVIFVGELTDMGGDSTTSVWFEYGKTSSYGETTNKETLSQPGFYCISVSGLSSSTTYHYRAVAENSAGTSYGENRTFTTTDDPSVEIRANGSTGSITIPHNSSATLTWISSNVNSCHASGAWSGTKATSGSESTGSITSSKTYTITCSGPKGSVSNSVTVSVGKEVSGNFTIRKSVRNLSTGTVFSDAIYANPGDMLNFGIVIQAGSETVQNVVVKDVVPNGLIYQGDLKVNNVFTPGNIITGLNIGTLSPHEKTTITFRVNVAGAESFPFGQTEIINTALVSSDNFSLSDTAKTIVSRTAVKGIATDVSTGFTNNILIDYFLFPLLAALLIVWLLKSRVIKVEEWIDLRKKQYKEYKTKKMLQLEINKIKAKEFFQGK